MFSVQKFFVILAALGMLMFLAGPVMAGYLDGHNDYVEGDADGSAGSSHGADDNDEEPGYNPNQLTAVITVTGWGPIDKCFSYGGDTLGVSEYFMTENITNGLLSNITDFHLELGWLIGGEGYRASGAHDGLDFDWTETVAYGPSNTPPPTATKLTNIVNTNSEDLLDYYSSGALDVVPPDGLFTLTYSVDVPNAPAGTTHLVIRQWATPEPGTFVLLAMAGVSALLFVWRKRRTA